MEFILFTRSSPALVLHKTHPVVVSQAGQVGYNFSHFHLGRNNWHFSPQVSSLKFFTGKRHLCVDKNNNYIIKIKYNLVSFHQLSPTIHSQLHVLSLPSPYLCYKS